MNIVMYSGQNVQQGGLGGGEKPQTGTQVFWCKYVINVNVKNNLTLKKTADIFQLFVNIFLRNVHIHVKTTHNQRHHVHHGAFDCTPCNKENQNSFHTLRWRILAQLQYLHLWISSPTLWFGKATSPPTLNSNYLVRPLESSIKRVVVTCWLQIWDCWKCEIHCMEQFYFDCPNEQEMLMGGGGEDKEEICENMM